MPSLLQQTETVVVVMTRPPAMGVSSGRVHPQNPRLCSSSPEAASPSLPHNMKKETVHHPLSALALIPCLFSVATSASAEVRCAPTVSPTHVRPGGAITLQGNCRDFSAENPDGIPLTQGAEAWQIALASGNASVGQRSLPDGTLTVT